MTVIVLLQASETKLNMDVVDQSFTNLSTATASRYTRVQVIAEIAFDDRVGSLNFPGLPEKVIRPSG